MTRRRNRFTRSEPLFNCNVCERKTRNPDHSGTYLCVECYDIAGLDNHVNDNGYELTPEIIAERDALFNDAISKGGNADAIKKCNTFLWPK